MLRLLRLPLVVFFLWLVFKYGGGWLNFYQAHREDPRLQRAGTLLREAAGEGTDWLQEQAREKLEELSKS